VPPPAGTPDFNDVEEDVEEDPQLAEYEQWEAVALAATVDSFVADERHNQEAER
jgi:hypothetical protein